MLSIGVWAELDTNSTKFYMYTYFYNVQQEAGARLAFSTDGYNWELYNNEKPIIVPIIARGETPLMRDPNIYFDATTGVFHLTWTTAWNQDNVGYSSSTDLVNWSEQIMIPVGAQIAGCACCWAPEFIYDDIKDSMMIYWSTERGTVGKEAFCSMTKNFKHYTTPRVYFAPKSAEGLSYNVIDETILKVAPNKYYMFFKDERTAMEAQKVSKNIHFVVGSTPQGPWEKGESDEVSYALTGPGTEGPTSFIFGDEVRLYFDPYNSPESTKRSRVAKISNFLSAPPLVSAWSDGVAMKAGTQNFLPGHGSISEVPRAKVMQLLYGKTDKTVYAKKWAVRKQTDILVGEPSTFPADIPEDDTSTTTPERVYPRGKRNTGCGTGVGLALLIPIGIRGAALRRRKQTKK